jgi:glycosyltransferase involved in cell wall biosynthesis
MISVIMSVYKPNQKYLNEAIQSILNQTYKDFEFIIVNDGDNVTVNYGGFDPRIKVIHNEKNIGLTKSLNKALKEAKGEYIARIDADDISYPERFYEQVKYLNEHPKCVLVGTWVEIIDEQGKKLREVKHPCENEVIQRELIKYNPFFHSSIMFRKGIYYNDNFKYAQDYELYFRLTRSWDSGKKELANIPLFLHQYRETSNSITSKKNREQIGYVIIAKVRAFLDNGYSLRDGIYLIKTCMTWLMPVRLKRLVKNVIYKLHKIK